MTRKDNDIQQISQRLKDAKIYVLADSWGKKNASHSLRSSGISIEEIKTEAVSFAQL